MRQMGWMSFEGFARYSDYDVHPFSESTNHHHIFHTHHTIIHAHGYTQCQFSLSILWTNEGSHMIHVCGENPCAYLE